MRNWNKKQHSSGRHPDEIAAAEQTEIRLKNSDAGRMDAELKIGGL